ncbi:unnamed protein product [Caenorhabditis brenneri]
MLLWLFSLAVVVEGSSNGTNLRMKRAPASELYIINPAEVETSEELFNLEELTTLNLPAYIGLTNDETPENARKALNFLARQVDHRICGNCNSRMGLVRDKSVKHDQYTWRCAPCKKGKISMKAGLRAGSFFENLKVTIQEMLFLAADWVENPDKKINSVAKQHKINRKTVIEAHEWFRRMTMQWFLRESAANPDLKLGGPGTVVEIDETLVYRAKYNRGRMLRRKQVWVFGMIQRGTSKIVMFRVPRRNADTLLPLIAKYVKPGTTIVSDGWAAYGGISNMRAGFTHRWVNHKLNFVDPGDSAVHTQSIEASWNGLKTELRSRCGVPVDRLEGHMFNYMWRRAHNREKLLNHLIYEMKTFKRDEPDEERVEVEDAAVDDSDSEEDEETDEDDVKSTSCESSTSEDDSDDVQIAATAAVVHSSNSHTDNENEEANVATDAVQPLTLPESILKRARDRDSGLSSDIDIADDDTDEDADIVSSSQNGQLQHSAVNHSPAERRNRGGQSGTRRRGKNNRGTTPKKISHATEDVPTTLTTPTEEADMEETTTELPATKKTPRGATRKSAKARSPSTGKVPPVGPNSRKAGPSRNQEANDMEAATTELPATKKTPGGATRKSAKARSPSTGKVPPVGPNLRKAGPSRNQEANDMEAATTELPATKKTPGGATRKSAKARSPSTGKVPPVGPNSRKAGPSRNQEANDMEAATTELPATKKTPGGATRKSAKARSPSTGKVPPVGPNSRKAGPSRNQEADDMEAATTELPPSTRTQRRTTRKSAPTPSPSTQKVAPSRPKTQKSPASEPKSFKPPPSSSAKGTSPGIKEPAFKKSKPSSPVKTSSAGSSKGAVSPSGKVKSPSKGSSKRGKHI